MILRAIAACLSLSVVPLLAQTPPCIAYNDTSSVTTGNTTAFSFAGNARAYQFQVAAPLVLFSAEILTGNTFLAGQMSLEIYDSNLIFQPGSRLGGGAWQAGGPLGIGWQGANFDQPVVCTPGTTYWLVWRDPGFSELPEQTGGTGVTWSLLDQGTWVTQATAVSPKWRGFCSLLDSSNVESLGSGCGNSGGTIPVQYTNFEPSVGNADFLLETSGNLPNSIGLIVLGTDPTWPGIPLPGGPIGCEVYTDLGATATITCDAAGYASFAFPIPASAATGLVFNSQFAMLDLASGAPLPFVTTNGLRWTTF